jgi:hypothetical protein
LVPTFSIPSFSSLSSESAFCTGCVLFSWSACRDKNQWKGRRDPRGATRHCTGCMLGAEPSTRILTRTGGLCRAASLYGILAYKRLGFTFFSPSAF